MQMFTLKTQHTESIGCFCLQKNVLLSNQMALKYQVSH